MWHARINKTCSFCLLGFAGILLSALPVLAGWGLSLTNGTQHELFVSKFQTGVSTDPSTVSSSTRREYVIPGGQFTLSGSQDGGILSLSFDTGLERFEFAATKALHAPQEYKLTLRAEKGNVWLEDGSGLRIEGVVVPKTPDNTDKKMTFEDVFGLTVMGDVKSVVETSLRSFQDDMTALLSTGKMLWVAQVLPDGSQMRSVSETPSGEPLYQQETEVTGTYFYTALKKNTLAGVRADITALGFRPYAVGLADQEGVPYAAKLMPADHPEEKAAWEYIDNLFATQGADTGHRVLTILFLPNESYTVAAAGKELENGAALELRSASVPNPVLEMRFVKAMERVSELRK